MDLLDRQVSEGKVSLDLDEKAMALLMGHKNDPDMPQAINVLSMLDKANKTVRGIKRGYESLSEIAHPNWKGTAGLYLEHDRVNLKTRVGKNLRRSELATKEGLSSLIYSLMMFEYAYNRATDLMPQFIKLCEADLLVPKT